LTHASATISFVYVPERFCPELDPMANMTINIEGDSNRLISGSLAIIPCIDGFAFTDRSFSKTLQCQETAEGNATAWNDTVSECQRKYVWTLLER